MKQNGNRQTSKSVVRNVFYGFLTWILPLGLSFVATPVIVKGLGNNDYGIYALVLGFIGYSFTFSFGRAITKYIAEYRVSGESDKIRDVISASFFLNIIVGLTGTILICVLAGWLVRDVFRIEPAAQQKTVLALYVASGIIFISTLNQLFNSVLQGIQRFDIYSKIFTANSLALIGGNLVLAFLGYGLLPLLVWNLAVMCISCIIFAITAKRLLPEFAITFRFHRETLRMVLKYSAWVVGYQVIANVLLLFERGWITQRLGTENLTYYVVPMGLGMYLHGFVSSLVLVIFPLASELKHEREKLLRLYSKATKIIALFVIFVVTSVFVNSKLFLLLWMGQSFAENASSLLILHICTFGLAAMLTVSWQMTEGLGFPKYNVCIFAICLVVSMTGMLVLTNSYGNIGVAVARLAGFGTIFCSIFLIERLFFSHVQFRFWFRLAGTLGAASVAAAGAEYLVSSNMAPYWTTFVLSVFCGVLAFSFVLWLLDFITADERLLIKRIIGR